MTPLGNEKPDLIIGVPLCEVYTKYDCTWFAPPPYLHYEIIIEFSFVFMVRTWFTMRVRSRVADWISVNA